MILAEFPRIPIHRAIHPSNREQRHAVTRWGIGTRGMCGLLWAIGFVVVLRERGRARRGSRWRLTATIDRLIAAHWAENRVAPAPPADDAEFLRRVCLDLAGKIPTAAEAREFLDDPRPDKRRAAGRAPARQPGVHRPLHRASSSGC